MFGYISVFMGIYDEWARSNNIDITKMKILHGLYFGKCNKQRDVVAKYNLSRTTVSSSIKIMSSKQCGLVNVDSTNKTLSLTAEGIEKGVAVIPGIAAEIVFEEIDKQVGGDVQGAVDKDDGYYHYHGLVV